MLAVPDCLTVVKKMIQRFGNTENLGKIADECLGLWFPGACRNSYPQALALNY